MIALAFIDHFTAGSTRTSSDGQDVGLVAVSAVILYCWFAADATHEGYSPSPWLKLGVVLIGFIFIPYYLLRAKGLKRAALSFGKASLLLLAYVLLLTGFDYVFGFPIS